MPIAGRGPPELRVQTGELRLECQPPPRRPPLAVDVETASAAGPAGVGAMEPATVLSRDRVAFTRSFFDVDIYRLQPGRPPEPVVAGSFADFQPQFSPDGRRIAFGTARAGEVSEIWVAAADGSRARQPTDGPGRFLLSLSGGSPRQLVKCAKPTAFSVTSEHLLRGVWFGPRSGCSRHEAVNGSGSADWPT